MHGVDLFIGVGWAVFWLYWLSAAAGAKAGRRQSRSAGIRIAIAIVVIALSHTGAFRGHTTHDLWRGAIGVALFTAGLGLAVWARIHLGRNWGSPMSQKVDPELVTSGPYRWVRNPIYSGLIAAGIGTAIAVNIFWLVVVALLGSFFIYSAFEEQRFLERQFPETFPAYKRRTKMLIPFVL